MNVKHALTVKSRRRARRAAGDTMSRPTKPHGSARLHKDVQERESLRQDKDEEFTRVPSS